MGEAEMDIIGMSVFRMIIVRGHQGSRESKTAFQWMIPLAKITFRRVHPLLPTPQLAIRVVPSQRWPTN